MFRDGNMKIMYINGYVKKRKLKQTKASLNSDGKLFHQYQQIKTKLKQ